MIVYVISTNRDKPSHRAEVFTIGQPRNGALIVALCSVLVLGGWKQRESEGRAFSLLLTDFSFLVCVVVPSRYLRGKLVAGNETHCCSLLEGVWSKSVATLSTS